MNNRPFHELPQEIQDSIKRTLKAYSTTTVIFENGRYHESPAIYIKRQYTPDHEVIGEYKACDIFTPDEQIINYIESFLDYPRQYKGIRDYAMMKELTYDDRVGLDSEGNIYKL